MSVQQIDDALRQWKARLGTAAQNLIDLQSHPVYQRISAPEANLSGRTADQAATAVSTLGYLLQCFDLLQRAIDRAEELRRDMPSMFGAEEREREISTVLKGKSIQLPSMPVPLQHRSLSTSSDNVRKISPPELLTYMESSFENVKSIVLTLDAAWEKLGTAIEQATRRLGGLRDNTAGLSPSEIAELNGAARELESVENVAKDDPLGPASERVSAINETLARTSARVEQLERERKQAREALWSAQDFLASMSSEREAVGAVCAEAALKTGAAFKLDAVDQKRKALEEWLERLKSAIPVSAPASLLVGIDNWTHAAQQTLAAQRAISSQAQAALAARSELRGRLDALKAKARAHSLAEDDELMALAKQATEILYKRPTPMDEAASLVSAYEAKLNLQVKQRV